MTRDKPFGKYAHNLLIHAPIQYRIISGESINAEQEERTFNTIQSITKGITNNRRGHFIGNMMARYEYKTINKVLYEFEQAESSTIKEIKLPGENLVKLQNNSLFTYNYIQNNSADWQSHLQRITDFVILENIWWQKTESGIELVDCDKPLRIEQNPKVHHFRSASIDNILGDLEQHWSNITRNNICIPTHEILVGNENEPVQYRKTQFLSDKILSKMLNSVQSSQCHLFVDDRDKKEESEKDLTDFILSSKPVTTAVDPGHQDCEYDYTAIFCPDVTSSFKDQQLSQLNFGTSDVTVQTTPIGESSPINNNVMQNNEDSKPNTSSKADTFLTREAQAIYKVLKHTSSLLESYDNEKKVR